jgi:hypothetical protein
MRICHILIVVLGALVGATSLSPLASLAGGYLPQHRNPSISVLYSRAPQAIGSAGNMATSRKDPLFSPVL